ncbi:type II secretion system F family protein [Nesterenkonia sp. NBAIMH1]|uniref:type II secretion system F family protein n=1 Tax=Nesterenkonia sp. NBAIMH1 TaxID=2600320 RepID=UPI0011B720DF|nr:type II secretion system F family protein [Nesterenkonia sp. NBAIMH1]
MTVPLLMAVGAGLALSAGLMLILAGSPAMNQPQLVDRVAPYLRSAHPGPASRGELSALRGAASIFTPLLSVATAQLERFSIGTKQLTQRLDQAASNTTVSQYRLQQVAAAGSAGAAAMAAAAFLALSGAFDGLLSVLLVAGGAVTGVALRDHMLVSRIKRRKAAMLREFPTIAEMMALSVGAGESAPAAFERVVKLSRGELAAEFTRMLHHTRSGASFPHACRELSRRLDLPPLKRFIDGILVAVERGTPLADVMRAQAADVQELSKRELLESAGRKEIGMLAPVVFGIMPLTVLFAVFPGAALLSF